MRTAWISLIALTAVLAVVPARPQESATSPANAGNQPATKATYRIAGTILSARDGHPLRNATVRILPANRGAALQTTTSDDSGQFAFTGVPAGTFVLDGAAPGFVPSSYEQHGNFNTGIVTGAGVDTESLVLALEPEGNIRLTVTDESGDPVQAAQIRLFRQTADAGDDKPTPSGGGRTDDLGRWESAALRPGDYFLVVQAAPWYAVHPNVSDNQPPVGFVESIQPALDVAYPITYYPGATDESAATPVEVRGGDAVELSMQLRAEPAFSITVPSPPPSPVDGNRPGAPPPQVFTQVMTKVFGQADFVQAQQSQTGDHMVLGGLAPGEYELRQQHAGPNGAIAMNEAPSTTVRITDHSLAVDAPADSHLAHVTAEVHALDGTRVSRPTQILLLRNGAVSRRVTVDNAGRAAFDLDPGDYTLDVQGGARSLHLKQVFAQEKPIPNRIHVEAGTQAAYVLNVAPGNHTVRGIVERSGKPAAGVFVLMIPTADLKDPQTFYRDQSDLDGSFHIAGIAAGDYTLFAVQHGWELNWHQKATYDRYVEHATAVHVDDAPDRLIKLSEPVQAQPR